MPRLVFIIAIFLLIWLAFRYFRSLQMAKQDQKNSSVKNNGATIEEIKPCAYCGVHMPVDEMLSKDQHHFCSYQHMLKFDEQS